jgi:PIN domain nuclease of toxin-antitoxin system
LSVLLDTHSLVWAISSPKLLSARAAAVIADESSVILVSAASAWEIATKVRLGKFAEAVKLEARFMEALEDAGYRLLPITPGIALRAGRLVGSHGDPFDRMIAAHALSEDIPVISADAKLDVFKVRRIW